MVSLSAGLTRPRPSIFQGEGATERQFKRVPSFSYSANLTAVVFAPHNSTATRSPAEGL